MMLFEAIGSDAVLSPCKTYRYILTREWGIGPKVGFIMLNPSTADWVEDDPTIRRCMGFAQSWGYDGIEVANLFAFRATNPNELLTAHDPIGPENDSHISSVLTRKELVVAAWGNFKMAQSRASMVTDMARELGKPLHCLHLNKNGSPKHPLYVSGLARPIPVEEAAK